MREIITVMYKNKPLVVLKSIADKFGLVEDTVIDDATFDKIASLMVQYTELLLERYETKSRAEAFLSSIGIKFKKPQKPK